MSESVTVSRSCDSCEQSKSKVRSPIDWNMWVLTARADKLDDAMSAIESQNDGGEAFTGSKSVEFYI